MGNNGQKYRYGNLIVEVRRIGTITPEKSRFSCIVRGYGHGNTAPRETFVVEAESTAQASRNALQKYTAKYGK